MLVFIYIRCIFKYVMLTFVLFSVWYKSIVIEYVQFDFSNNFMTFESDKCVSEHSVVEMLRIHKP